MSYNWFGLVWFNCLWNIIVYWKENSVVAFVYIKYMICKHILSRHKAKWSNSSVSDN